MKTIKYAMKLNPTLDKVTIKSVDIMLQLLQKSVGGDKMELQGYFNTQG